MRVHCIHNTILITCFWDTLPGRRRLYYSPPLSTAALTASGMCCPLSQMAGQGAGFCSSSSRARGTFPKQHLPLLSKCLLALENLFNWKRSSEVLSLTPMPPTYQQSVTEREHQTLLDMKKVLVLQCCLGRMAECCRTPVCFPNCHSYWLDHSQNLLSHPRTIADMAKIVLFPKSRQEVSTSPNFQSRRTSVFRLNICRKLALGYL